MTANERTLYLIYNADGSILGKIRYGYRKVTAPTGDGPVCAACDMTHGGLSLSETPAWIAAKAEVEGLSDIKLVQWHRDELSPELREYLQRDRVALPVAVLGKPGESFQVVADKASLTNLNGDASAFVGLLREKGLLVRASL